jgi:hypothetical protein
MYQPQLEDLENDKLTAIAAISGQTKEMKQPVFGAVWLAARVTADRDTRLATIDQVKVTAVKFPDAKPEQLERIKKFLNEEMTDWSIPIGLDRLVAAAETLEKAQAGDQGLNHEPPKVIFRTNPAVLVLLDGEPKLLPIPDSKLMQVANTPFAMLYDPAARSYYLKGGDQWLSAAEVAGPWKDLASLPPDLKALMARVEEKRAEAAKKKGGQPPKKEVEKKAGKLPEIIVSTVPAELLVTEGEPQFTPIPGTGLLFVSNTESNIFLDTGTQEYYTLLSGRWFKTKTLPDGPYAYVAPDKLPADFAKIPPESTKGFVLVNVAQTTQAKEAVLDNSIPQTAVIDRKKAKATVKYAGEPKFEKVAGTDLEYAVNTGTAVFKEGTKYYAVEQGVWYEADSPTGPWKVSDRAPQEVGKLPPSNPHYNTKYVKVYDSTDDTVTVGYTPGYTGSYVDNGTVVYGTGYNYPSYSTETAYIPYQSTYGYAATYDPYASTWGYQPSYYSPWSWLGPGLVGFGAGMLTGYALWGNHDYHYGGGWWGGGGYHYNNVNINHNYINNRNWNAGNRWPGERPGERPGDRWPGYRPGDRPGARPTPYGNNLYNRPWNQGNLAGRPATRPVSGAVADRPGRPGERPAARPSQPSARPGTKPAARPAQPQVRPAGGQNNVVADRSGNVYRKDNQGNLQQRQGNQWAKAGAQRPGARPEAQPATRPTQRPGDITQRPTRPETRPTARPEAARPSPQPGFDANRLNREFQARDRGQARTQQFQRAQSSPSFGGGGMSRPSGGGAGFRGGGGGGGRGGGGRGGRR